jgi:hypothetical protein
MFIPTLFDMTAELSSPIVVMRRETAILIESPCAVAVPIRSIEVTATRFGAVVLRSKDRGWREMKRTTPS